ncbi:hypothetical protein EDB19DRAFT_1762544 [Suillus lakei]|nr:hypothetical protein EDB19DRAFT_1762544 [Suillus lakei]
MSRSICITAADGQIGHLITELLLSNQFKPGIDELFCVTLHPDKCEDLEQMGATIITHKHMRLGTDLAEEKTQPHLRQFTKIETEMMQMRDMEGMEAGTSQCIIRAGYYAEHLLLYEKDVKNNGMLRLPIGNANSFAPVVLGDVVKVAANILVSKGSKGLSDRFRGQLITLTGPMMCNGIELAAAASQAGVDIGFADISDTEAKQLLESDTDVDDSEKQYLLEYYSLVREGKTNYVSTLDFAPITGEEPTKPPDFFKMHESEFKPKKRHIIGQ